MKNSGKKIKYIVGIDEAGRGPLAGPVCVAGVLVHIEKKNIFKSKNLKDSKQLSEKAREKSFEQIKFLKSTKKISFSFCLISSSFIDRHGISKAVSKGISKVLDGLKADPKSTMILLDGGIKAPKEYVYQETIIKGDEKIPVIAKASVVAKVTRDNVMKKISGKFPFYNFQKHKGYGTKNHIEIIKKIGPSPIHRRSFLKNII